MRDFRSDCYNNDRPQSDFAGQSGTVAFQAVNIVFQELVHQVLEKIKNKSYFKWSNKMSGDHLRRNQNLHCQYHLEWGHTTEDYRTLWNHLKQLVREGRLQQFPILAQRTMRLVKIKDSRGCSFKASIRHNQCHLYSTQENQFSPF